MDIKYTVNDILKMFGEWASLCPDDIRQVERSKKTFNDLLDFSIPDNLFLSWYHGYLEDKIKESYNNSMSYSFELASIIKMRLSKYVDQNILPELIEEKIIKTIEEMGPYDNHCFEYMLLDGKKLRIKIDDVMSKKWSMNFY